MKFFDLERESIEALQEAERRELERRRTLAAERTAEAVEANNALLMGVLIHG